MKCFLIQIEKEMEDQSIVPMAQMISISIAMVLQVRRYLAIIQCVKCAKVVTSHDESYGTVCTARFDRYG
jgi:hypothetical protein